MSVNDELHYDISDRSRDDDKRSPRLRKDVL